MASALQLSSPAWTGENTGNYGGFIFLFILFLAYFTFFLYEFWFLISTCTRSCNCIRRFIFPLILFRDAASTYCYSSTKNKLIESLNLEVSCSSSQYFLVYYSPNSIRYSDWFDNLPPQFDFCSLLELTVMFMTMGDILLLALVYRVK